MIHYPTGNKLIDNAIDLDRASKRLADIEAGKCNKEIKAIAEHIIDADALQSAIDRFKADNTSKFDTLANNLKT